MKKQAKGTQRKSLGKKPVQRSGNAKASSAGRDWSAPDEQLYRPIKKPVTLRLDADLLSWFKAQGRGYQTRINRALRGVMMKERKAAG